MALMSDEGGVVDPRFNALSIMEKFGWDYQQYLNRPLWFDPMYQIKTEAEKKYQEIKDEENKS